MSGAQTARGLERVRVAGEAATVAWTGPCAERSARNTTRSVMYSGDLRPRMPLWACTTTRTHATMEDLSHHKMAGVAHGAGNEERGLRGRQRTEVVPPGQA